MFYLLSKINEMNARKMPVMSFAKRATIGTLQGCEIIHLGYPNCKNVSVRVAEDAYQV